jgi:hypothetical protein
MDPSTAEERTMSERISNHQLDRVGAWLETRTNATCPFCHGRVWTVDTEMVSLPAVQSAEPKVQLDRGHALVLVTCEQCGFTAPFAAKKLGVSAEGGEPDTTAG